MPDVFEINDPPIIVINKKYKPRLFDFIKVNPELDKLLKTLIIKSKPLLLFKYINTIKHIDEKNIYISSLCSLIKVFLSKILNIK